MAMNFLSTFGITGNNIQDPFQKMQHTQFVKQQLAQWLQQQNSKLRMRPEATSLLGALNNATSSLQREDELLGDLGQIHQLVLEAPQEVQEELEERIKEAIEKQPQHQSMQNIYANYGYNPRTSNSYASPDYTSSQISPYVPSSQAYYGGRKRRTRRRRRQRGGYSDNMPSYGSNAASFGGRRRKRKTCRKSHKKHTKSCRH
jgi:hypothetical protein